MYISDPHQHKILKFLFNPLFFSLSLTEWLTNETAFLRYQKLHFSLLQYANTSALSSSLIPDWRLLYMYWVYGFPTELTTPFCTEKPSWYLVSGLLILTSTTGGHETAVNLTAVLFFVFCKQKYMVHWETALISYAWLCFFNSFYFIRK